MAYTLTRNNFSAGNYAGRIIQVSADGAEANLATKLGRVVGFTIGVISFSTAQVTFTPNTDSSGTASNGTIGMSGVNSGDEFFVVAWGTP